MKWIAKHLKPKAPQNIWDANSYVKVLEKGSHRNIFKVQIGKSIIEKLFLSNPTAFWSQDFSKTSLSFLLRSSFHAEYMHIESSDKNNNDYKIAFFRGSWMSGDLVCDEFMGNILGGTLKGVFNRKNDNQISIVHPSVNIDGRYQHNTKTSNQIDDKNPVYGIGPYKESPYESVSILALNTGQVVEFTTNCNEVYAFFVYKSYKETGRDIHLIELTHQKRKHVISWSDLMGINNVVCPKEFDVRSTITIGLKVQLVKLFSSHISGAVVDIRVANSQVNNSVHISSLSQKSPTHFRPVLLKF